ncbi:MAG: hypothetical protein KAG97_09765, partial [Victivallales bacterium]|nr:hypothetical protein [Victivallales bacterium]
MKRRAVRMIGTTHFDPVWMWTWDEGMASIRSTFRSALDRMNEDENFVYSFSAPPVFEWIREVDPPMFEEIRRRVREGRWELVEGWWVQPHCFSSLGETYVRQGLYGQRYLSDTFGVRSKTAFNTDSFGHCVTLPQILRLCGIEGYVFGRPSDAQQELPSPFFRWRGIDGSTVLAFRFGGGDANAYSTNLERDIPSYAENAARKGHDSLMVYGVSNHGGAPTKAAIAAINKFKTGSKLKCDVDFSRLDDFFGAAESDCPTEYDQELVTSDFGVYINGVSVKQRQRECEIALLNAEKSALIANRGSGRAYPKEKLAELWCDALFNQFHDIIGGASVPEAFTDAGNLHGKILWETKKIIHYSLQSVTREIDTSGEAFPVVAWNLNSFEFKFAIEAELQWAWEFEWYDGPLTLRDAEGRHIPSQIIQETSALPRFRSRFLFEDTLPSLGYALYHVNREEQPEIHSDLTVGKNSLENSKLKIIFSETNGGLQSVIDKESGEAIFHNTVVPVIMDDPGCVWTFNIGSGFEREVGRFEFEKLIVLEKGPLRAKVRIVSCFGNSVCEQDFSLRKNSPEIEGTLNVFWNEKNKALKLAFASGAGGVEVVKASTPYGWV